MKFNKLHFTKPLPTHMHEFIWMHEFIKRYRTKISAK